MCGKKIRIILFYSLSLSLEPTNVKMYISNLFSISKLSGFVWICVTACMLKYIYLAFGISGILPPKVFFISFDVLNNPVL